MGLPCFIDAALKCFFFDLSVANKEQKIVVQVTLLVVSDSAQSSTIQELFHYLLMS